MDIDFLTYKISPKLNRGQFAKIAKNWYIWAGTRRNTHPPTHCPDHHPIFISFFHLPWSI